MKNIIITISLVLALTASSLAGSKNKNEPFIPNAAEFAEKLVGHFGGEDEALDQQETIVVLDFLQDHLPEQTGPTNLTSSLSREYNVGNAGRNDITEERHALREYAAEEYVDWFVKKYDIDNDSALTSYELTDAMANVIGLPLNKKDMDQSTLTDLDPLTKKELEDQAIAKKVEDQEDHINAKNVEKQEDRVIENELRNE